MANVRASNTQGLQSLSNYFRTYYYEETEQIGRAKIVNR